MNVEGWVIIRDDKQPVCSVLFHSKDDARQTLEASLSEMKARIVHLKEAENEDLTWRYYNDGLFRVFVERKQREALELYKERAG
jgi:hypothetical protein